MNVLMINGSPNPNGCTFTALTEVAKALDAEGISSTIFNIGTKPINGCIGCERCRNSGVCALEGPVNQALELAKSADALILGCPVHFASAPGAFVAFLDRFFRSGARFMRLKPGAAVVSCRRGGASATFDQINKYFTISQMPVISSKYWNSVHGYTPEDVAQDVEGLQVMRVLGRNLAWLLKCIDYSKGNVPLPAVEAPLKTNFIR